MHFKLLQTMDLKPFANNIHKSILNVRGVKNKNLSLQLTKSFQLVSGKLKKNRCDLDGFGT